MPSYPFERTWWVKDSLLLAGPYPGTLEDGPGPRVTKLVSVGFRTFIKLQEPDEVNGAGKPFADYESHLEASGKDCADEVRFFNFPIPDMSITSPEKMLHILNVIDDSIEQSRPVYIHCWGGHGRTGTVVGCWLVRHGMTPQKAFAFMEQARKNATNIDPCKFRAPQHSSQFKMVEQWAGHDSKDDMKAMPLSEQEHKDDLEVKQHLASEGLTAASAASREFRFDIGQRLIAPNDGTWRVIRGKCLGRGQEPLYVVQLPSGQLTTKRASTAHRDYQPERPGPASATVDAVAPASVAHSKDWFEKLTGLEEKSPEYVREHITVEGDAMTSRANGKSWICGYLRTPTLADLRSECEAIVIRPGRLRVSEVVADVQQLHKDPANAEAMFQVASQFNLLEMISPDVTPEMGVGRYQRDPTQGPACAIAAGSATIYRNYFTQVNGAAGQTISNQIDCLANIGQALGNADSALWTMTNGYAMLSAHGLKQIDDKLSAMNESEIDALRQQLRIGVQSRAQITLDGCTHTVSQAFCSALPVTYAGRMTGPWERFARLILEAAYEATFAAAIIDQKQSDNPRLYLTLLGGGAFGNDKSWILDAIKRSLRRFEQHPLEVHIVSYGVSDPAINALVKQVH